jgi:phage tail sheath protein FI
MPPPPGFSGVYVEEQPSGVRVITGVPTSITAFIGRARRGPVESDAESPVAINGVAEFNRRFGGLWKESALGFAVRDFFLNGGSQALIVRLYHAVTGTKAKARLKAGALQLEAAYPGAWANKLRARIDHHTTPLPDGSANRGTFNLSVRDGETGEVEFFANVSVKRGDLRRVDKVLANNSKLVRVVTLPRTRPRKHAEPKNGRDVWDDNAIRTCDKVSAAGEASDGGALQESDFTGAGKERANKGLYALNKADLFNLLCIPGYRDTGFGYDIDKGLVSSAATYCEARRAMLLIDSPASWRTPDEAKAGLALGVGTTSKNAALFFPRLRQPNPERNNQKEDFGPGGAVAGVFARTDTQGGVWKTPAGLEATLIGTLELAVLLTDAESGALNPLAVNCLRSFPVAGPVVWGSRTLASADQAGSEWKYIPVRRTALFIEESLYRGTKWVVFERNDEPLWAQIRLNIGAFLQSLFRKGAFQGTTPKGAYFVKCDRQTTTPHDIDIGVVNIIVGFAPHKPAEFVVIKMQQRTGQIGT